MLWYPGLGMMHLIYNGYKVFMHKYLFAVMMGSDDKNFKFYVARGKKMM